MIVFKPSKGIAKETDINFHALSTIFSHIIKLKRKITFKVVKSRMAYSFYSHDTRTIALNLNAHKSKKGLICTITHEIRHYLQKRTLGTKMSYGPYKSYNNYYTSPEEKDARKFEKICNEIYATYKNLDEVEKKVVECKMSDLISLVEERTSIKSSVKAKTK
jgi:Zn-dependent peptidase ImmA (M78 family)